MKTGSEEVSEETEQSKNLKRKPLETVQQKNPARIAGQKTLEKGEKTWLSTMYH